MGQAAHQYNYHYGKREREHQHNPYGKRKRVPGMQGPDRSDGQAETLTQQAGKT